MAKRGGARVGAGKKPISKKFSDALKKDVHSALARKAASTGKTFGDVLVDVIYDEENPNSPLRAGAFKIVQEILVIKETKTDSDIDIRTNIGPTIGLPPLREGPAEKVRDKDSEEAAVVH